MAVLHLLLRSSLPRCLRPLRRPLPPSSARLRSSSLTLMEARPRAAAARAAARAAKAKNVVAAKVAAVTPPAVLRELPCRSTEWAVQMKALKASNALSAGSLAASYIGHGSTHVAVNFGAVPTVANRQSMARWRRRSAAASTTAAGTSACASPTPAPTPPARSARMLEPTQSAAPNTPSLPTSPTPF